MKCPECGREVDINEAEIDYPDVYFECECGYDLSGDFYFDVMENWISSITDRMERDR